MLFSKIKIFLIIAILSTPLTLYAQEQQTTEEQYTLADQLYDLAEQHDFVIRGIDIVGEAEQRKVHGNDIEIQLQQFLDGFNYALVRGDEQQLERLIIVNKNTVKQKKIILETRRKDRQHLIDVSLQGINNAWLTVELLVDTGADRIVVPESMLEELGFDPDKLDNAKLQTVNGALEARTGQLKAISLGNQIIKNVDIAFVDDELLGKVMLLGMNVLSQYRMTLDDELSQITLIEK